MNRLFNYIFTPVIFKVKCQMCDEIIGIINLKKIKYPLTGDMIKSPDAAHGFPDPFYPGCEFEFMRCPYGGHRPMILPNTVLLDINRILNITPTGFSLSPVGSDRDYILDREQLFSPVGMMSDQEAETRARECLPIKVIVSDAVPDGEVLFIPKAAKDALKLKNVGEQFDGKTEIQQGQADGVQPVESKEEEKGIDGSQRNGHTKGDISDSEGVKSIPTNYCSKCNKQFTNKSGYTNHMRIKHKEKVNAG